MAEVRTKPVSQGGTCLCHALQPFSTLYPVHSIAGLLDPPKMSISS